MKKENLLTVIKAAGVLTLAVLVIVFAKETSQSVINSIDVCLGSVIPAMFSFMVISTYILDSGLYKIIFRPAIFLARKLIRTDDCIISVFFLSLFGGYPVGMKLCSELISYNKNYCAIIERAASFCYCISPSFAVIMLGRGVFSSTDAGIIIYISNVTACIITAAVMTRSSDMKSSGSCSLPGVQKNLIGAVVSSAKSLMTVCAVIVVFNIAVTCLKCVISLTGAHDLTVLYGMLEITNLTGLKNPSVSLIPIVSAISSSGGACVLFQSAAIANRSFSLKKFLLARIPCSAMSGIISFILLNFWDISAEASVGGAYSYGFSANKAVTVLMMIMCIIIFRKNEKIFKKV